MTENKPAQPPQLGALLAKHRLKAELVLSAFVIAVWFASPNEALLMPAIMALAAVYFLSAFVIVPVQEAFGNTVQKVAGISSAVSVIGILFKHLAMEDYLQMLLIAGLSVIAATVLLLGLFIKSQNQNYLPFLIRCFILSGITAWFLLPELDQLKDNL